MQQVLYQSTSTSSNHELVSTWESTKTGSLLQLGSATVIRPSLSATEIQCTVVRVLVLCRQYTNGVPRSPVLSEFLRI